MTAPAPPHRRRIRANDDFAGFVRRVVAAHGRRVATGDAGDLTDLLALDDVVQTAIRTAVAGLRAEGRSWAEIGAHAGVTRQAAQQRWGGPR